MKRQILPILAALLCPTTAFAQADLIVVNGNVLTMNAAGDRAQAVAARDGKIVAVGSNDAILKLRAAGTRVVDAKGRTVLPGLIDSHVHVDSLGENLSKVRMNDLRALNQLLDRIKAAAAAAKPGVWIEGASDWHESQLKENRFPTRWELDRVAPNNPVFLRRGGHNVVINTAAMKLAGIGEKDPDPPGGLYHRNKEGVFDGWVLERPAIQRIAALLPKATPTGVRLDVLRGQQALSAAGITAVRAQHVTAPEMRAWRTLAKEGKSKVRGVLVLSIHPRRPAAADVAMLERLKVSQDQGDDKVRIGGLKITHDGGVETSLLREDFANKKGFKGTQVTPVAKVRAISEFACRNGWRMSIHTVGDQAIQNVLDIWEKINETCPLAGKRWGLEHPYLPSAANLQTMKRLGIVPHMQATHNYTLGAGWVEYWGRERAERSIPNRTMIDAGLKPAGGTDAPVTPYDPFLAMWVEVTRNTSAAGVLGKKEAVTAEEALRMHTIWAAYGLGMEDRIGSIETGKYADLVVVSDNPLTVPADKLKDIKADVTILDGKVVHSR